MNQPAAHTPADAQQDGAKATAFAGFHPLIANYLYCPNQFFDICLKSNSRGMVRIVAYVLRQTIGWLDKNGQPINEQIKVSYRDLIEKAGVSRGAIGPALQRAVAAGFIKCCVAGNAKANGQSSQTAEYSIRWDESGEYTKTFEHFKGFFTGEGNRTPIPNAFFEQIITSESLAVTKVVGTVLRHTVGHQNQFGGRRSESPLSYSHIQNYTNTSDRSTLAQAIRTSINTGYIIKVEDGEFNPRSDKRNPASYAIRWLESNKTKVNGSKTRPADKRFKNQTSIGSKTRPAERFKNQTSNKTTNQKDINKQQDNAVEFEKSVKQLAEEGFSQKAAEFIVRKRGVAIVQRQLNWLDARNPRNNRSGLLRKAIEEDWAEPQVAIQKQKIKQARIHDAQQQAVTLLEEAKISEQKRIRNERKKRLLAEWKTASLADRKRWIELAASVQSAAMLRDIIRRQRPETEKPHVQVLDELAQHFSLPTVSSRAKQ